ncbi:MAG TPA: biotin transporter BioY [Vicinamibacterales bacterium]|nr:biotin transporter BioY [Vicinamibacterales bacterium]
MSATNSATLLNVLTSATSRRDIAGVPYLVPAASVLFFTVLTAAAAQISAPLPFTDVPLTLQPMVVLIGGLALGSRLGSASQILYLAAGIAGLPVFAASATLPPGALRLLGPTGGYLMAYPFAAFVAGWLAERGLDRQYVGSFLAMLAGLVIIFAFGIAWLALFARTVSGGSPIGISAALSTGLYPFLFADIIKLAIAAGLVPAVWYAIGRPQR